MKRAAARHEVRVRRAARVLGACMIAAGTAWAQVPVPPPYPLPQDLPPPAPLPPLPPAAPLPGAAPAGALGPAPSPAWRITPSVTLAETYSDNVALAPDELSRHGWITDLSPGLRVERNGARLRVFVDYRIHSVRYSTNSRLDDTTRYLDALATFEPVEKWLYVDARAAITQQNRSPFAPAVSPDAPSPSANRVETSAYQVSPYVRGHMGGLADYQVRYNETTLIADEAGLARTRTGEWVGRVRNPSPSAKLGWAVDAHDLRIRNDTVGNQNDSRASASVIFGYDSTLQLSVNGGRESTDFNGGARESNDTYGAGIAWAPSPRTQAAAVYERRFFGDAHDVSFNHRTANTALRLSSRRDATTFATQLTSGTAGTVQSLMADLLVAAIPDPVTRQQEARRRVEATGIPTGSTLGTGFLTERPYVLRADEASAAYRLPRDTFTVAFSRTERQSLGGSFTPLGGLATANDVRERLLSANWAHRLTPITTLAVVAAARRSEGINTPDESRQNFFSVLLTTRLGPRTYGSLGVRRTVFDSTAFGDYRENAIVGSFTYRP